MKQGSRITVILAMLALLVCQVFLWGEVPQRAGAKQEEAVDLVISLNLPEAEMASTGAAVNLYALRVYADGHFAHVTGNLTWKSSNQNVAEVDEQGIVHFQNSNGRTFVSVTDGRFIDRIAFDVRTKGERRVSVVKQKGERYHLVDKAVAGMTLEEKIGQMMMPDFRKWNGKDVIRMLPEIEEQIKKHHIGGVILFRENVVNAEQTIRLVHDYQRAAEKLGLLVAIDQEGGIVTRLQGGTDMPGNMALGAARSAELTRKAASVMGSELGALGINTNFAPVVDVNNNPDNPVIGVRSFGESPELVAELGTAYIKGLHEQGISATAKHFPGHGDTAVDSHLGLPEVPHDLTRLRQVELVPFQQAIHAGVDAIMTAHVTFPKIDDTRVISRKDGTEIALPGTLSPKVITGLIRQELGYEGVVVTDAMNMQAITDHFGPVEAAVRAVKAGVDIILMPLGLAEVTGGIKKAVQTGELSEGRIDTSVKRILSWKVKRNIFRTENPADVDQLIKRADAVIGSAAHKQVEAQAAAHAITLVKDEGVLPLDLQPEQTIVIIGTHFVGNLSRAVKQHHADVSTVQVENGKLSEEQWRQIRAADVVLIGSYTFDTKGRSPQNPAMQLYQQIIAAREQPVIVIALRNPYDIMAIPDTDAYVAQYGFRDVHFTASAAVLFGNEKPMGKLPVTIPDGKGGVLYPYGHGLE